MRCSGIWLREGALMKDLRDEELLTLVKSRNSDALAILIKRHHGLVFSVCRLILKSGEAAEDACQETFLTVYLKGDTFRRDGNFKAWLREIARTKSLTILRGERRRDTHEGTAAGLGPVSVEPSRTELELLEAREKVQRVYAQLSEIEQKLLRLCDIEDLSYVEISVLLGATVGAISGAIHRARESFRQKWNELFGKEA
jgi:RNA polymerase sigma-70 factor, ECF subfamily